MIEFPNLGSKWTSERQAEEIADWIELSLLFDEVVIKRGDISTLIPWATDAVNYIPRDAALEQKVWAIFTKRQKMLGASWPFRVDDLRLIRRHGLPNTFMDVYSYLLLISRSDEISSYDRKFFELLSIELISGQTGSRAYRIGYPALRGEPSELQRRIDRYAAFSHLQKFEVGHKVESSDKDLGLDGVFWMPFLDKRSGALHAWLQCATGRDWKGKTLDIYEKTVGKHILPSAGVIRLMAVPYCVILGTAAWQRRTMEAGSILDRTRLAMLATRAPLSSRTFSELRVRLAAAHLGTRRPL
ncbi:hypothetical protein [Arthrobacter sedimenti]|uniref:DUF3396 domain-containing protein n=1 Tax=Arthrobacter sedimenti TaxID=2694931 RepID=A0ABV8WKA2_9MICC